MRDEFSKPVQQLLAKRVGYRCSLCGASTLGPAADPTATASVGVAGHITAASPGGPRFDHSLSREERRSASNGIWACETCGKKIDVDVHLYTVDVLRSRKEQAEEMAHRVLGIPPGSWQGPSPLRFAGLHEPMFTEIANYYKRQRYETGLVPSDQIETKLLEGWEVALDSVSGREVWVVFRGIPREEHALMVRQPARG